MRRASAGVVRVVRPQLRRPASPSRLLLHGRPQLPFDGVPILLGPDQGADPLAPRPALRGGGTPRQARGGRAERARHGRRQARPKEHAGPREHAVVAHRLQGGQGGDEGVQGPQQPAPGVGAKGRLAHAQARGFHACITQGGPRRNERAQIVRPDSTPIPRLYSSGELGSIYSYLYQGTGNLGECLAFGRIAGRNAVAETPWG